MLNVYKFFIDKFWKFYYSSLIFIPLFIFCLYLYYSIETLTIIICFILLQQLPLFLSFLLFVSAFNNVPLKMFFTIMMLLYSVLCFKLILLLKYFYRLWAILLWVLLFIWLFYVFLIFVLWNLPLLLFGLKLNLKLDFRWFFWFLCLWF